MALKECLCSVQFIRKNVNDLQQTGNLLTEQEAEARKIYKIKSFDIPSAKRNDMNRWTYINDEIKMFFTQATKIKLLLFLFVPRRTVAENAIQIACAGINFMCPKMHCGNFAGFFRFNCSLKRKREKNCYFFALA